ncbi:hypothetical protein VULLAG_LOCUS3860 [Vulpes lagopus]
MGLDQAGGPGHGKQPPDSAICSRLSQDVMTERGHESKRRIMDGINILEPNRMGGWKCSQYSLQPIDPSW